jgi:hypothetical protein
MSVDPLRDLLKNAIKDRKEKIRCLSANEILDLTNYLCSLTNEELLKNFGCGFSSIYDLIAMTSFSTNTGKSTRAVCYEQILEVIKRKTGGLLPPEPFAAQLKVCKSSHAGRKKITEVVRIRNSSSNFGGESVAVNPSESSEKPNEIASESGHGKRGVTGDTSSSPVKVPRTSFESTIPVTETPEASQKDSSFKTVVESSEEVSVLSILEVNRKLKDQLTISKLEGEIKNYQLLLKDSQIQLMEKEKEIEMLKSSISTSTTAAVSASSFVNHFSPSSVTDAPFSSFPHFSTNNFFLKNAAASSSPFFYDRAQKKSVEAGFNGEMDSDNQSLKSESVVAAKEEEEVTMKEEDENPSEEKPTKVKKRRSSSACSSSSSSSSAIESVQTSSKDDNAILYHKNHSLIKYFNGASIKCRCCQKGTPTICSTCSSYFEISLGICKKCFPSHFCKMIYPENLAILKSPINAARKKKGLPPFNFDRIPDVEWIQPTKKIDKK